MTETKGSLQLTLDPNSLIPSQYSNDFGFNTIQFTTDSYFMERGPRYDAYAQLRESKIRSKRVQFEEDDQITEIPIPEITPVKKSVRFQGSLPSSGKKQRSSVLAQSVPDFSSVLRKENRKPVDGNVNRIPRVERGVMTTPPSVSRREKMFGSGTKVGGGGTGSRSVNGGRKSYASIEELKGLSIAASNAINGENKGGVGGGGRRGNVLRKSTILSTRYY